MGRYASLQGPLQYRPATTSSGSVLIIALWSLCIMASLAVILGYSVRQKAAVVSRIDERDKLRLIADAGVKHVIYELEKEPEKTYDCMKDPWSNNEKAFKGIMVDGGSCDIRYRYNMDDSAVPMTRYGVIDEESKININKMSREAIQRLLGIAANMDEGASQSLAASIVDWRDADSELSVPVGSAEDGDYRNTQHPYEAKDGDFEVPEETLLVNGMTGNISEKIKDYITIYGDGSININTASRAVLMAIGLSEKIAGSIISFRSGADGIMGNEDDNIFDMHSNIVPYLSQFTNLSASEVAMLSKVSNEYFTTSSRTFTVKSVAALKGKNSTLEVTAVIDREGKILYWRET